jgi:hypothetical protein
LKVIFCCLIDVWVDGSTCCMKCDRASYEMYFCQCFHNLIKLRETNYSILIITFYQIQLNYYYFQLLLLCMFSWRSKINSGRGRGWMIVPFIDWWNINSEVTCQAFDQSHQAFWMKWTHNVLIEAHKHGIDIDIFVDIL